MYTPKWLKDKDSWTLTDKFKQGRGVKTHTPQVGEKVGNRLIIGVWVGKTGYKKAYKTLCDCGNIDEYVLTDSIKFASKLQCQKCGNRSAGITLMEGRIHPEIERLMKEYGEDRVRIVKQRWLGMTQRVNSELYKSYNISMYTPWYDLEVFLKYVINIKDYDKLELAMDRRNTFKNYEPGNIRFITCAKNNGNNRNNILVTEGNKSTSLQDFIRLHFTNISELERVEITKLARYNHINKEIRYEIYIKKIIEAGLIHILK